jgi:hypothetical protein
MDIVPEGTAFQRQPEIEAALKRQGNMKINKGDVVIFYTGWHKLLGVDDKRNGAAHPGLGRCKAHVTWFQFGVWPWSALTLGAWKWFLSRIRRPSVPRSPDFAGRIRSLHLWKTRWPNKPSRRRFMKA